MTYSLNALKSTIIPKYNNKSIKTISISMIVLLFLFTTMWLLDILSVIKNGDTAVGSYATSPVMFWTIAYMDLGFTIPLGFISAYLLLTRPEKSFPVTMLFFGFFVTMSLTMNTSTIVQLIYYDTELALWEIFMFGSISLIVGIGFYHIIKPVFIRNVENNQK